MKVKDWLIHKLGGITLEDAYRERHILIQYKQSNVITYKTMLMVNKELQSVQAVQAVQEQIYDRLAFKMLDAIKENMEIECRDCPETGMVEYRATLRMVKVE